MTPEAWAAFVQQHGGIQSQATLTPNITDPATGKVSPNPNSATKYVFGDNTWVTAIQPQAPGGVGPPGPYQILQTGTAIKPATNATTRVQTQTLDGQVYQYDPATSQWKDAQGIPADMSTQTRLQIAQQNADTASARQTSQATIGQENADTAQGRAGAYAANVANNAAAKQAANDLAQARLNWQQIYQGTLAQVAQGKLTLAQAQQVLTEQHQQVSEWLTQRSQDLQYADSQGKTAQQLYSDILTKTVPAGANQSLTDIMNNQGAAQGLKFNLQPGGGPAPDPVNFVQGATQRALQNLQSGNLSSIIGQNPRTVGQPGQPQPMQAQPAATPFVPGNNESPVQPGFSLSSTPAVSPTSQMAPPFGLPR